jgi:hypothetical protein
MYPIDFRTKEAQMFASRRSPFFWRRRRSQYSIVALAGIAAATAIATAAAVYYLDPESGRRRRGLLRDRAVSASQRGREIAAKVGLRARERATAIYERSKSQAENASSAVRSAEIWPSG